MNLLIVSNNTGDTAGMYEITPEMISKIKAASNLVVTSILNSDLALETYLIKADILISTDLSILTSENSKNLKWVHITSAGTNKIPDFLKTSDTLITNSSGVHPIPISEHVFGLMLMLIRNLHKAYKVQLEKKQWFRSYNFYAPEELFGKKVLIVGMGRIGERIAEIAKVFGMESEAVVRDLKKKRDISVKLYEMKDLKKVVKNADFVINALPGTEHTKGVFDIEIFNNFKPSAYFINIGRGASVVESDLIHALKSGTIAGAGLDVFETEPLSEKSELWNLENVIITPHYSGWTPKYTERVIDIFIKNLKAYLKKQQMPNLVDKKLGY